MPGWKRDVGRRLDTLIARHVPGVRKAVKWIDVHEDDLDEVQMSRWIRQAAALPGWGKN